MIKELVLKSLSLEGIKKKTVNINICFLDDIKIKKLNQRFLAKNIPTDVIAFNLSSNKKTILADIAISTETALRNAKIFKTSPFYEIYLYIIHGLLHILGYDDKTERQKKIIQKKAEYILDKLKLYSKAYGNP
ncbi:MAG: rRNA maturation RNase YbeY [Candidatus Omnitrophica bacterium]|nr:rRNA maturation RNase YbeY [Candidatus Omnitrophota bacterium]